MTYLYLKSKNPTDEQLQVMPQEERDRIESEFKKPLYTQKLDTEEKRELQRRLDMLKSTDMALVVSPGQNEIEQMRALGLDIVPH